VQVEDGGFSIGAERCKRGAGDSTRRPGVEFDPENWKRVFGKIVLKTKAGHRSNDNGAAGATFGKSSVPT